MAAQTKQRGGRLWLASALAAFAYGAAHPDWSLWPLAFVAGAPLAAVLLDPARRTDSLRAAGAGALFAALAMAIVLAGWDAVPDAAAPAEWIPVIAAFATCAAVAAAVFAALARLAGLGALAGVVGGAALWTMGEVLRAAAVAPLASPAAALAALPDLTASMGFLGTSSVARLLALGGEPLLIFALQTGAMSLGLAWARRGHRADRARALLVGLAVVVLLLLAADLAERVAPHREGPAAPLRVGLVQAGSTASRSWPGMAGTDSFARHLEASGLPELRGAGLLVWPDGAARLPLDDEAEIALRELAQRRGAAVLVGDSRAGAAGHPDANALLVTPDGGLHAGGLLQWKGWSLAPLVGDGAATSAAAVGAVARGADLLVHVADDGAVDRGAAPQQRFAAAILRAAETRRPLVRVAATGISAMVGERGTTSWRLPSVGPAVVVLDVVPPRRDALHARGGRAAFLLLLALLAAAAAALPSVLGRLEARDGDKRGA